MSQFDQFSRLGGPKYLSLPNTETGSSRRTLPHHFHPHHHHHHHLLKLILLSVALTGGCLCYLTIYYQLTTLVTNTEPEPDPVHPKTDHHHPFSSSVVSNYFPSTFASSSSSSISSSSEGVSSKANFTGSNDSSLHLRQEQTIINTSQLDTSESGKGGNEKGNNNNLGCPNDDGRK